MPETPAEKCVNCGKGIYYDYDGNWVHADSRTNFCVGLIAAPVPAGEQENSLDEEMERNAMIETVRDLEAQRDELLRVSRMVLQQFDFMVGTRKRGWDIQFLREQIDRAIRQAEGAEELDDSRTPSVSPSGDEPLPPRWAVTYNIGSPESDKWVGTGWEFFDDEKDAITCYQRQIAQGNCPTKRPYYRSDAKHLGAVHCKKRP